MTNHVGGFACPICGLEYIHEHSPADIVRLHNLRKRAISIADFDAFSAWIEKRDMKTLHGRPVWAFELWLAAKDHYKAIPDEPSCSRPFDCAAILGDAGERRISMRFETLAQYEAACVALDMADAPLDSTHERAGVHKNGDPL